MEKLAVILLAASASAAPACAANAADLPPWLQPTRRPTPAAPTPTPSPTRPAPTAIPTQPPSPGEVRLEFFAAVSLGAMRSAAIPSGRYWVRVNGSPEVEMRQPAAPGQAARPIDGSVLSIPGPTTITARLVRSDGYSESYTFNVDPNRLVTNQRTTAGFPARSRVSPSPQPLLAGRR